MKLQYDIVSKSEKIEIYQRAIYSILIFLPVIVNSEYDTNATIHLQCPYMLKNLADNSKIIIIILCYFFRVI